MGTILNIYPMSAHQGPCLLSQLCRVEHVVDSELLLTVRRLPADARELLRR